MAKVMLGSKKHPVRFSYANVFVAKAMNEGDTPKYSVSILIDKKDKESIKKFNKAFEEVKVEGKSGKWGGKIPKNLKGGLRDGDEDREDDEVYEDKFFVNANSKNKPGVVDADVQDIIDGDEFYSGCYGRVTVNLYPYDFNGSKGIAVGLGNIQKLDEGERLGGGGASAESDFGEESDDDGMLD